MGNINLTSKMIKQILFCCLISLLLAGDCPGKKNEHKLVTTKPDQVDSVPHGKKFIIRHDDDPLMHLHVAVLNGTAYEMGFAMGKMFKEAIHLFMEALEVFFIDGAFAWEHDIAKWMEDWEGLSNKEKVEMG